MTTVTAPARADVEAILGLLRDVRSVGPDRWEACCSDHQDRRPSLGIRLTEDGRILVHRRAGCRTEDVLRALGLDWSALFPDRPSRPVRQPQHGTEGQRARREVLGRERRAAGRRRRWLPLWLAADHVRELMKLVGDARSAAGQLGETPATWTLLSFAAVIEVEAFTTEAALDAFVAEGRLA